MIVVVSHFCLSCSKIARISLVEFRVSVFHKSKIKSSKFVVVVAVVIKGGFNFINYYRKNLVKRSFCHIAFMWERDISHQYPSVKGKVTESARYVHDTLKTTSTTITTTTTTTSFFTKLKS